MLSLTALMTLLLAQEVLPQGQADPSRAKPGVESTLQDPEDPALRAATKGLGFLEKEGIAWTKKNKCSSCHHVPMMLWAEREARQGGLRINEQARERAVAFALQAPYGGFLGP
ncbi:MAG TPA: hypothetical protein VMU54_05385, partial [Planctomycetota bacterium]|nr:hypothetical protein [Planctomycetota bacterium]